jgi:SAM-dependent methyltransferase
MQEQPLNSDCSRMFYDAQYESSIYASAKEGKHPLDKWLRSKISFYNLQEAHSLEVGSGRGALQDVVKDYTGVDLSESVAKYHRKRFFSVDSTNLPFPDNEFDLTWTYAVLEHVPNPQAMLEEMRRVTKPGGLLFLHAAWHCPTYAADGIPVRRFRDLPIHWWPRKVLAWIDRLAPVRAFRIVSFRLFLLFRHWFGKSRQRFYFKKIKPNYETFWMSDSDACCSMDQLEAWFWFRQQGDVILEPRNLAKAFLQTNGELVIRLRNDSTIAHKTIKFGN